MRYRNGAQVNDPEITRNSRQKKKIFESVEEVTAMKQHPVCFVTVSKRFELCLRKVPSLKKKGGEKEGGGGIEEEVEKEEKKWRRRRKVEEEYWRKKEEEKTTKKQDTDFFFFYCTENGRFAGRTTVNWRSHPFHDKRVLLCETRFVSNSFSLLYEASHKLHFTWSKPHLTSFRLVWS